MKCIAKSKGVHREVESEESWRQDSGLTNRNHIRLQLGIRLQYKSKFNNYSGLIVVKEMALLQSKTGTVRLWIKGL